MMRFYLNNRFRTLFKSFRSIRFNRSGNNMRKTIMLSLLPMTLIGASTTIGYSKNDTENKNESKNDSEYRSLAYRITTCKSEAQMFIQDMINKNNVDEYLKMFQVYPSVIDALFESCSYSS